MGRDDDKWRDHKSFQNIQEEGTKETKRGSGPQFNRVIPKFLQKYHNPIELDHEASLAMKRAPEVEEEDDDEEELDEVQVEALRKYAEEEKKNEKDEEIEVENAPSKPEKRKAMTFSTTKDVSKSKPSHESRPSKKTKALDNKKLLSFSMDDD